MRRSIFALWPIFLIILLTSCGASVQRKASTPQLQLRDYNNIVVNLVTQSGSVSLSTAALGSGTLIGSGATLGQVGAEHAMPASEQARLALESLRFELMGIGFNFVNEESKADAIVDFYIGTIRYDPIAGWIADQAFVKFKDQKTNEVLAFFRANTVFITPTTSNIISKLSKSIRKSY